MVDVSSGLGSGLRLVGGVKPKRLYYRAPDRKILSEGRFVVGGSDSTQSGSRFTASDWLAWLRFQSF